MKQQLINNVRHEMQFVHLDVHMNQDHPDQYCLYCLVERLDCEICGAIEMPDTETGDC